MAEHSTVNRRVAGSSPAWGVFSIIRARIRFKPFFNACILSSGLVITDGAIILGDWHY